MQRHAYVRRTILKLFLGPRRHRSAQMPKSQILPRFSSGLSPHVSYVGSLVRLVFIFRIGTFTEEADYKSLTFYCIYSVSQSRAETERRQKKRIPEGTFSTTLK